MASTETILAFLDHLVLGQSIDRRLGNTKRLENYPHFVRDLIEAAYCNVEKMAKGDTYCQVEKPVAELLLLFDT